LTRFPPPSSPRLFSVIPAEAGIQSIQEAKRKPWVPAFAGMTREGRGNDDGTYCGFFAITNNTDPVAATTASSVNPQR
jgi:hypothetical protein